jgi:hypothetical protein
MIDGIKMLLQDLPLEDLIPCVDQDIVAMYIAEPTVLLVEVLVNRLSVFVNGDGFPAEGVGFLEIILAAKAVCPINCHLYFLVDQVNSAFYEDYFLFSIGIVQSLQNLILLILQLLNSVVEESVQQMPNFRLVAAVPQSLNFESTLVLILDRLLQQL